MEFPSKIKTDAERREFLYRAIELCRLEHNKCDNHPDREVWLGKQKALPTPLTPGHLWYSDQRPANPSVCCHLSG